MLLDRVMLRQKIRDTFSNPQRLRSFLLRFYPEIAQQHSGTVYDPMVNDLLTKEYNEKLFQNIEAFNVTVPVPQDTERGLYQKYKLTRTDGKSIDPQDRYFVLKYNDVNANGSAARAALEVYCQMVEASHPALAKELRAELQEYQKKAFDAQGQ